MSDKHFPTADRRTAEENEELKRQYRILEFRCKQLIDTFRDSANDLKIARNLLVHVTEGLQAVENKAKRPLLSTRSQLLPLINDLSERAGLSRISPDDL